MVIQKGRKTLKKKRENENSHRQPLFIYLSRNTLLSFIPFSRSENCGARAANKIDDALVIDLLDNARINNAPSPDITVSNIALLDSAIENLTVP